MLDYVGPEFLRCRGRDGAKAAEHTRHAPCAASTAAHTPRKHGRSHSTRGCPGGRITTFPAPPTRAISSVQSTSSSNQSTPNCLLDNIAQPQHCRTTSGHSRPDASTPRVDVLQLRREAGSPRTQVRTSSYTTYPSSISATGVLTAHHSVYSSVGVASEKPCAQALTKIHIPKHASPPATHLPHVPAQHSIEACVEQFNAYLDVHDCQVVSCSPTASPGSHAAPTDSPRDTSPRPRSSPRASLARKLLYSPAASADAAAHERRIGPGTAAGHARAARMSLDFDPVATAAYTATAAAPSLLTSPRTLAAPPASSLGNPLQHTPGRVSLCARSAEGCSAGSNGSSSHPQAPRECRPPSPCRSGGTGPEPPLAADLISAHCRTVSSGRPVQPRLQPSPFSMSSFCGSADSGLGTANLNMHARCDGPALSGSETSEDLDSGTLPPSEHSDPFLEDGPRECSLEYPETPTVLSSVPLTMRVPSTERVLSYDPDDSRAHVFRTFQHVPGPPARTCTPSLATPRLPRCFCGGGESLYGSACMCGGASSFVRAGMETGTSYTETVARRSEEGTCFVWNGPSLIDDTSDSNVIDTRTITDASGWGQSSGCHGRMRSSPSPSDSVSGTVCACGDIADSGVLLDAAPAQPVRGRPWARIPAPDRSFRHPGDHAVLRESWAAFRTASNAPPARPAQADLIGCEDSTSTLDDAAQREVTMMRQMTKRMPQRGQHALNGALRRVHAESKGAARDTREVEVQVHAPPSLLRRALLDRVFVPRITLPFRRVRGSTARSASVEPRRHCVGAL